MSGPTHHGFGDVDAAPQPAALADYLDRMATSPIGADYTRWTLRAVGVAAGHRVLDVGCGAGHALLAAAELVGPDGYAIGADSSATMLAAAHARVGAAGRIRVGLCLADAQRLPFADGVFDRCRAERVLQHLPDPAAAVAEMVRVTRPGGRLLLGDTDWGGWLLEAPDDQVTRAILEAAARRARHPWIGRQLLGLFRQAGLHNVQAHVLTYPSTDFDWAARVHGLAVAVERAVASGALTGKQGQAWLADRRRAAAQGWFLSAIPVVTVVGER
jgi:ubiquinone/menaquinone biosynthesis C-methylase UbiE